MRWQYHVGLVTFALLLFILPIPHTISLRYFLLLSAAGLFGYLTIKRQNPAMLWRLRLPALLFTALSVWIVLGAVLLSQAPSVPLNEIRGQWLTAFLALTTGLAAGVAGRDIHSGSLRLLHVVVLVLFVHVLSVDVQALWLALAESTFTLRAQGLTDGPDKASFLTNMLLAFILSELLLRFTGKPRTLKLNNGTLAVLLVLTLLSLYAEGVRNAVPALLAMGAGFIVFYWVGTRRGQRKRLYAAGVMSLLVVIAVSLSYATVSKRGMNWDQTLATIPVALDTKGHKNWLDTEKYGLPSLPGGGTVEESTYLRIAWIKESFLLISDHPLGIGFNRNAFGHGLMMKYGEGRGHSHSGILDMAIGTGIPGALLWLAFLVSLAWLGLRCFCATGTFATLTLSLIVLDYSTRMFVDSIVKDHMLQQFMLVAGLLAAQAVADMPRSKQHAS
jgi:hypothetical protein